MDVMLKYITKNWPIRHLTSYWTLTAIVPAAIQTLIPETRSDYESC